MELTVEALGPTLNALSGIQQNPAFHGEGDALTHTRLVMEALQTLPAYAALEESDRHDMLIAAALHDLGKKVCTRLEGGQWTSPNHSVTGASMVRELLMTRFELAGTPEALRRREAICSLVRWHMRPAHVLDAGDPGRLLRQMAAMGELTPSFSLEKLAMLAEADVLGRICGDQQSRLEAVAMFYEASEEQGCARRPFLYPDAYSRYADLSGRNIVPGQSLYNDTWGTVVMMCGLPGTGKDTYIARHFPDLPMLSLDDARRELGFKPTDNQGTVIQTAQERARELLRRKRPFVFNATNLTPMLRGKWSALFHQYGASVEMIYLETPWAEREKRNASRRDSVPESAVTHMLRNLTPPVLTEAEQVRWVCV